MNNAAANSEQGQAQGLTLGEINAKLSAFGIAQPMTAAIARVITQQGKKARFVNALATGDENAKRFLKATLDSAAARIREMSVPTGAEAASRSEGAERNQTTGNASSTRGNGTRSDMTESNGDNQQSADDRGDRSGGGNHGGTGDGRYPSIHVYGGKGALSFEVDETRKGVPTVCVDAASSQGPRKFDWRNKIRLQLTRDELPIVAAVFLGFQPCCEFSNHGENNSKGFTLERQHNRGQKSLFMRVFEKDKGMKAVPIPMAEAFLIQSMLLHQLCVTHPHLDGTMLMTMLRSVANPEAQLSSNNRQGGR